METIAPLLSLVAGISGLVLAWRAHGVARQELHLKEEQGDNQHRSGLIDDLEQVLNAVRTEYARLKQDYESLNSQHQALRADYDRQQIQLEQLKAAMKKLADDSIKKAFLEERLDIERELFSERVKKMEAELERLRHLETNA